jgi:beta-lactamase regulating signal transducer with metallopeptidase domain
MNEIVHTLTDGVLRYLVVGSAAALVLVLLALAFLKAARLRTPVYRHMVWLYCLMGIVGLPLIWLYGPKLTLAILPASAETHEVFALPGDGPHLDGPSPDAGLAPPRTLTAEMSSARQERTLSWKTAAAAVWFLGFSLMLTRLAVGWVRLRRICRSAIPLQGSECPVGIASPGLRLCLTSQLPGPVCFGVFRPIILLPQDMVRGGSPENRRMVLTHELAHVERRDCWANLFQRIVEAAYFFHPLVWLASRQLTQQREEICDNHVLAEGVSADDYTTLLSHLGAQSVHAGYLQTVALFEGQLLSRIRSLLDPSRSRQTKLPWRVAAICTVAVLAAFLVFGSIRLAAQPSDRAAGASPEGPLSSSASTEQKPTQSPTKAPANSEKPDQPRYAARTFNSKMRFNVCYRNFLRWSSWGIGQTPSATPLEIPTCWVWWVQPQDAVVDWDLLVREIRENKVPGLKLDRATDSDVKRLADLTGLRHLDLIGTKVTDSGLENLKDLTKLQDLRLGKTLLTDVGLEHLKGMTGLQLLDLGSTQITGAGLAHLKGLSRLQSLFLTLTPVADAGLEHLKGLTELQNLRLSGTQITDAGLEHLKDLTHLQSLMLSARRVTGVGLPHLKGLTGLQRLNLNLTQTTDAGLESLGNLTEMLWLHLSVTQITDAGLACLKNLTKLEDLSLSNTRITDAGLVHLKGLERLQRLNLTGTQVTEAGVQQLKQSLPKAIIERGELPL